MLKYVVLQIFFVIFTNQSSQPYFLCWWSSPWLSLKATIHHWCQARPLKTYLPASLLIVPAINPTFRLDPGQSLVRSTMLIHCKSKFNRLIVFLRYCLLIEASWWKNLSANWIIIVPGNKLAPNRSQAITRTNAYLMLVLLVIWTSRNKLKWNINWIKKSSPNKFHVEILSAKWLPFYSGLIVLISWKHSSHLTSTITKFQQKLMGRFTWWPQVGL